MEAYERGTFSIINVPVYESGTFHVNMVYKKERYLTLEWSLPLSNFVEYMYPRPIV